MWPDNETDRDFLNFTAVAETVAEIIVQAHSRPISIGVSGAWGVGKSSMIKLIRHALMNREKGDEQDFLFVEFNAWLYQGYDDARAALMEEIARALEMEARERKTGLDKAQELLRRVDWLRAAKLTAGSLSALALGLPPVGLLGEAFQLGKKSVSGKAEEDPPADVKVTVSELSSAIPKLIKPKPDSSPPKEIHAIRTCFEEALSEMGVTLVVLIDDLDRCLPPTTISTLEAIRLFLFLKNTAFVIAADNDMIKHAVRKHYEDVDDKTVTNYFDKLIQVPIRVPPLGTQEVRAYMMLLFVENSSLEQDKKEEIRQKVCQQLGLTWQGKRVDRVLIESLYDNFPSELIAKLDTADRLAHLMTTASNIEGNPRLIKRFLNALSIRMAISAKHGVGVDEKVLAKMLLFERCGEPKAYAELTKAVNNDEEGKPRFLAEWEEKALDGKEIKLDAPWDSDFVREWLIVPPRLSDLDLRGILYVSREHSPIIMPEDRLSAEAADLLTTLLTNPDMATELRDRLAQVPRSEITIIMDKMLDRARQEQEWGVPPILEACLEVTHADPAQGTRLAAFLTERPPNQVKPNIVPKISDQPWAKMVYDAWVGSTVQQSVKRAIRRQKDNGNVAV